MPPWIGSASCDTTVCSNMQHIRKSSMTIRVDLLGDDKCACECNLSPHVAPASADGGLALQILNRHSNTPFWKKGS